MPEPKPITLDCCSDCGLVRFDHSGHCHNCGQRNTSRVEYVPAASGEEAGEGHWTGFDEVTIRLSRASATRLDQHLSQYFGAGSVLVQQIRSSLAATHPQNPGEGLRSTVENLREAAAKCRDNAIRAKDYGHGSKLLGEGTAYDVVADDLEALALQSAAGEHLSDDLDPRKRGVVRDAMVLGFCKGALSNVNLWTESADYPRDSAVVEEVLASARSCSDLYPALAALAEKLADRSTQPEPEDDSLREAVAVALAMLEENRQAAAEQVLHRASVRASRRAITQPQQSTGVEGGER